MPPNSNIAAKTVKTRKVREGVGDWSSKTVHTPSMGSDRSASMARRGRIFRHCGCKLNSQLCRFHSRAEKAAAAIHATVAISGMSYRLPE